MVLRLLLLALSFSFVGSLPVTAHAQNACVELFGLPALPLVKPGRDGVRLVNPDTGKILATIPVKEGAGVAFVPQSGVFAIFTPQSLDIHNRMDGRRIRTRDLSEFSKPVVTMGPSNLMALTDGASRAYFKRYEVRIENAVNGQLIQKFQAPDTQIDMIGFVQGSHDLFLRSGNDIYLYILNPQKGYELKGQLSFIDPVSHVVLNKDGMFAVLENEMTFQIQVR